MRAFVALQLPEGFATETAALSRSLGTSLEGRFLPRDVHHLTLAFLGDIDDSEVARAMEAMDEACEGIGAASLASDGLGKFGRTGDATLWLGIKHAPDLELLAARLREALASRDVPYDAKPFKPHITLARRVRIPKADLPPLAFPNDDEATSVTLYKSTLGREGATYKPLYSIDLGS